MKQIFAICVAIFIVMPPMIFAQDNPLRSSSVAWSPDGTRIAATSDGAAVKIWSADNIMSEPILVFQPNVAINLEWTPDSDYLVVQEEGDGTQVTKWDAKTGEMVEMLLNYRLDTSFNLWLSIYGGPIIAFDSTFTRAAFSLNSNVITISDEIQGFVTDYGTVYRMRWSPDNSRLAAATGTGDSYLIQTFEFERGVLVNTISGGDYGASDIQWSADSKRLAVASVWANPLAPGIANVRVFLLRTFNDYETPEREWKFDPAHKAVIAWHPSQNWLAIASPTAVEVYDIAIEKPMLTIPVEGVTSLDWSPNGTRIVGVLPDSTLQIWEMSEV